VSRAGAELAQRLKVQAGPIPFVSGESIAGIVRLQLLEQGIPARFCQDGGACDAQGALVAFDQGVCGVGSSGKEAIQQRVGG
jgi:hypothetical protein